MTFEALFEPKGVVVAGASTHPAKFGFVPVVSGIRSGTSSDASLGATPTVPDGGICSAGSEYGLVGG